MEVIDIFQFLLCFACLAIGTCQNRCRTIPVKTDFNPYWFQGKWHVVKFLPLPNYDRTHTLLRYSWDVTFHQNRRLFEIKQYGWSPTTRRCIEANATLTQVPGFPGEYIWKTDFDTRVNNAETVVVATDYDTYAVLWNCVRNRRGTCDHLVTVHSRAPFAGLNRNFRQFVNILVSSLLCKRPRDFFFTQVPIRGGIRIPDCSPRRFSQDW